MIMEKQDFIDAAVREYYSKRGTQSHVLYPENANVVIPEFDPCRVRQPIAIVEMPAIVNCAEKTVRVNIYESI